MILTPFSQDHFAILPSWFPSVSALVQWGGPMLRFPLDEPQMQAMLAEGQSDPPRRLCWMAKHSNQWAGHIQLAFDWQNGIASPSRVAVNPALRGQDLASPMVKIVMQKAFNYPDIERLELNVFTFNTPAEATYEKLGFVYEGIRRSSVRVGDERWDTAIMSILRSEFEKQ